jgi:hypothetical protein
LDRVSCDIALGCAEKLTIPHGWTGGNRGRLAIRSWALSCFTLNEKKGQRVVLGDGHFRQGFSGSNALTPSTLAPGTARTGWHPCCWAQWLCDNCQAACRDVPI